MQRDSGGLARLKFRRNFGGYTIVEVMVVLAVGLVTFFAAVTLFAGKQGRTEFSQAMRDVESQIQSVINDVGVSTFPDASSYTCEIMGNNRPRLDNTASPTGTNTECIFLGKAIRLDNSDDAPHELLVYTVLGRTLDDSDQTVTNFDEANPSPIIGSPSDVDLTIPYPISFGATVLSAHVDPSPDETDLVGFYNSLQPSGSASQGSQSLLTKGYVGFDSKNPSAPGQVQQTIEGLLPIFPVTDIKTWTICFQSGTSNETAKLVINASFSGITTKINYTSCT